MARFRHQVISKNILLTAGLKIAAVCYLWMLVQSLSAAPRSKDGAWEIMADAPVRPTSSVRPWVSPDRGHWAKLDSGSMRATLARAPQESRMQPVAPAPAMQPLEIEIPSPDGTFVRFSITESSVMEPELAAKYPEIKTYIGQGIDDRTATARIDWTPQGFHASVLSASGSWYVDPYWNDQNDVCVSYFKRDLRPNSRWRCLVDATTPNFNRAAESATAARAIALAASGASLRTFRLACAATGEYTAFHGGTVALGQAAIVTCVNRLNQVYEADFAIRLVLVGSNDQLVYTDNKHDPYNNANANLLLNQNQNNLDSVIGSANYDIGHVVGTGGGGLAYLGVVCTANKARGETGSPSPTGDGFYIDYVAHEMGHQFGGNHCFNGVTANCTGGNRNASTAMEPGSGTSIMCYAGICGADDLQPNSDPYFHSISYDEIMAYVTTGSGNSCAVLSATGNNPPIVNAGTDYIIPRSTPFTLTASGSDADGDTLTYCWEERDLGAAQLVTTPDNGASPIFRTWNPTTDPSRTFPRLVDIIANTTTIGEQYPTLARAAMKFRVTVRDNRAGGSGSNADDMQLQVVSTAGPFAVTAPNTAIAWSGNQTVTWNVASTNAAPINTALVNIRLSTDGGVTFPTILLANTPNDGSQLVTLPEINTSTARIKVEAVGNVYWDMSNATFTISPTTPVQVSSFVIE